ncbi:MAG: di-heme oxidoredictase family protein [Leptothrix sp. (in: b-proteobacteria)]
MRAPRTTPKRRRRSALGRLGLAGALLSFGSGLSVPALADELRVAAPRAAVPLHEAFSQPLTELDDAARERFLHGRSLFRRAWVIGPTADGNGVGLGPLYNRLSCIACHPANGRGRAPDTPDQRLQSMLVRLSLPGTGPHGGPRPHPAYGDQLNEEGVPGVPGEARVSITWREQRLRLPDGEVVSLRQPRIDFIDAAYGPLQGVLTSARVGPGVYGLGLLEAVPDAALEALARQAQPDGVHGRLNRVWDPVQRRLRIGRFGWKANVADLEAQVVQAAAGDLGLTSPALPEPACAPRQTACRQVAAATGSAAPELGTADVQALTDYMRRLAPPPERDVGVLSVELGRRLFAQIGCALCHRPALPLTSLPGHPPQQAAAYTDLLLHDMGPGLADGRPDYRASARQWRTAPLWGLGLVPQVNEHSQYLHDGRARGLQEAVLWHGGEAARARQRYVALPQPDRQALLAFVASR